MMIKPSLGELASYSGIVRQHSRYEGCVGHWLMVEGGGITAYDYSGYGNNGTLTSGPTWSSGKFGSALSFDGVDDFINAGSAQVLDDLTTITISAWIFPKTVGEGGFGRIVSKEDGSSVSGLDFDTMSNFGGPQLVIRQLYTSGDVESLFYTPNNSITLNAWQHVALVYNSSNVNNDPIFYINGVLQTTNVWFRATGTRVSDASNNVLIGNEPNGSRTFNGLIDDVRIYNRALADSEIFSLYTQPFLEWDEAKRSRRRRYFTPSQSAPIVVNLNQVIESTTSFALSWNPKHRLINTIITNENTFSLLSAKNIPINLLTDNEQPFSLTSRKQKEIGLVTTNNLVQPIHNDIRRLINQSVTSETLFLLSSAKQKSIGMLTTTESPFVLGSVKTKELGSVVDSETLFAVTSSLPKLIAVNLVTENDTPFLLGHLKAKLLGLVNESLSPFAISPTKLRSLGMVSENEQLFALTSPGVIELGAVVEHDLTFLLLNEKSQTLQLLTETTTLSGLAVMKAKEIGFLAENETLTAVTYPLVRLVPQVTERDQLFTVMVVGPASTITYANASHIRRRRRAS